MAGGASILKFLEAAAPYVEAGGKVAQGLGSSRAAGRTAENTQVTNQDLAAIQRYEAEQRAKAAAALLEENAVKDRADRYLTSGRERAQQVGLGDVLASMQDVQVEGMPNYIPKIGFSGGLRPSLLGPNARQAGANLSRDALAAQISGADVPNLPNLSGLGTDAPALSELAKSGKLDEILNLLSAGSLGVSTLNEARGQQAASRAARNRLPYPTPQMASDEAIGALGMPPEDPFAGLNAQSIPQTGQLPPQQLASRRPVRGYQL